MFSAYSNEANSSLSPVLVAPTNLTVTTGTTGSYWTASFSWTNNVTGASSQVIQISTDGTTFSDFIVGINGNATSSNSSTHLTDNINYYFRIKVIKSGISSDWSDVVQYIYPSVIPAIPNPLVLVSTKNSNTYSEALSWIANGTTEKGFIVYRSIGTGAYSPLIYNLHGHISTTDTISYNGVYNYKVAAYNDGGISGYSNVVSVTITDLVENPNITFAISPVRWSDWTHQTYYGFTATPNKGVTHKNPDGGVSYRVFNYATSPPYAFASGALIFQSQAYPDNEVAPYLMVASPYSWNPVYPVRVIISVDYNGSIIEVTSGPFLL